MVVVPDSVEQPTRPTISPLKAYSSRRLLTAGTHCRHQTCQRRPRGERSQAQATSRQRRQGDRGAGTGAPRRPASSGRRRLSPTQSAPGPPLPACTDITLTDVALPNLLRDLDVRAVDGADEQTTVQAELHVRCPACFRAGRRDVLADVRCGDEDLRERDRVVWEEEDLQVVLRLRVCVDDPRRVNDQPDRQLCNVVCMGCDSVARLEELI